MGWRGGHLKRSRASQEVRHRILIFCEGTVTEPEYIGELRRRERINLIALRLLEEHEHVRVTQQAEFNRELGRRLASLDKGERTDPAETRMQLQRKSHARRKQLK